jgi:hypothetical protein
METCGEVDPPAVQPSAPHSTVLSQLQSSRPEGQRHP